MTPSSSATLPVIPPSRGGDGRRRPRLAARGFTLTCTRHALGRPSNLPNLSRELLDLGWGGVRFVATEPLQLPCPVNLQIRDERSTEVFHARGEIAWVQARRREGVDVWVAGARFDEILTPVSKCALFFEGRPSLAELPAALPVGPMRRSRDRFPIEGCDLAVRREASFFGRFRKSPNLALGLVDLSRTGAQVISGESLKPGERLRFSLHLPRFKDTLEAVASVMWVSLAATGWRIGLEFRGLARAQQVLLASMESWFTHAPRPGPISKVRPPLA